MSYEIAQYISNNFNNSSLNVALPVILNGIETLAIAENTNQGHNLPIEAYELLRECFYEFYEIEVNDNTNTPWQHFYSYIQKFPDNFLVQEIVFTPVLRTFILKQMGFISLNQYDLMEKELKEIDLIIKSINEEIQPDNVSNTYLVNLSSEIQDLLISFLHNYSYISTIEEIQNALENKKTKLTAEIKQIKDIIFIDHAEYIGNFKPVTIDEANTYLYQPFGIEYHLRTPEQPVLSANHSDKNKIFIMQSAKTPNKFLIDAEAYGVSFKDLTDTYNSQEKYIYNFCRELYLIVYATEGKNPNYTELMLEVLQWYINDNLIPNKAVEKILNLVYPTANNYQPKRLEANSHLLIQQQQYEFTEEEIQTFQSYIPSVYSEVSYNEELLDEDTTRQEESTYDKEVNTTLPEEPTYEEHTNLQFLPVSLVIGLTILAAVTLIMAIIFCPPIGIATAFGLSAGNALIASVLYGSAGLISGCSTLNLFFNHSKVNIEDEAKENLNNNDRDTRKLENVDNDINAESTWLSAVPDLYNFKVG